jgi:hypothetical protein
MNQYICSKVIHAKLYQRLFGHPSFPRTSLCWSCEPNTTHRNAHYVGLVGVCKLWVVVLPLYGTSTYNGMSRDGYNRSELIGEAVYL